MLHTHVIPHKGHLKAPLDGVGCLERDPLKGPKGILHHMAPPDNDARGMKGGLGCLGLDLVPEPLEQANAGLKGHGLRDGGEDKHDTGRAKAGGGRCVQGGLYGSSRG